MTRRRAWFVPWPRALDADPVHPPAPGVAGARIAADQWPALPGLWAEARRLDAIYNQRIARRCRRTP